MDSNMQGLKGLIEATTIGLLSLGIGFCAAPALGNTLTRQDFSGNFNLLDSASIGEPFPQSTEYSGFVTYDNNNSLLDWEINVEELNLSLEPDSNIFGLSPNTAFELSSPSNWNLSIDFGIAFDAPLYNLQRNSGEINFSLMSFGSFFNYSDPAADINVTSFSNTPVPEPSATLTLVAFLSTMTMLKRKCD